MAERRNPESGQGPRKSSGPRGSGSRPAAAGRRGQSAAGDGTRKGSDSGTTGAARSPSKRSAGDQRASKSATPKGGQARGASQAASGDRAYKQRAEKRTGGRPERRRDEGRAEWVERTESQAVYDGPPLDDEITGKELDRSVLAQLKGLPEKLAARVARHLVAVGLFLEEDPRLAYQHALAARARAARIAVVREAVGEAAYAAGEYAEALSELRAARRMNGANDYLPVMADCERALGRPEKALALAKNPAVASLPDELKAEMTIVEAGARADLGEIEGAVRTLEHAPLRTRSREDWVARLRYAYADMLLRAGRREDAIVWFHRTAGVDGNGITDAVERVAELEG